MAGLAGVTISNVISAQQLTKLSQQVMTSPVADDKQCARAACDFEAVIGYDFHNVAAMGSPLIE